MNAPDDDLPYEAILLLEQGKRQQAVFAVRKALSIDLKAALARVERWERNHLAILPRGLELGACGDLLVTVAILFCITNLVAFGLSYFLLP